jgi:multidrug efflux pump subunit AcrA (membrane-fusion protein)
MFREAINWGKIEMSRKSKALLLGALLVAVSFLIWKFSFLMLGVRVVLTTVEEGWLKHEKGAKAVFANTEIVLTAPIEGKLVPVQEKEGQRFRKGEMLATLYPTGVDISRSVKETAVNAPISGLFYRSLDNVEQVLTPENLMKLELNNLLSQAERELTEKLAETAKQVGTSPKKSSFKKYEPLGKIVNNLSPTWMFIYLESGTNIRPDQTASFIIDGEEYCGRVMKISDRPRGAVVCFTQFIDGTVENRIQDIVWYYKAASKGVLVPLSSLLRLGEEVIVYVEEGGIVELRNVELIDANDHWACVKGLAEGVRVVVNPRPGMERTKLS